ncbi:hypothetical protein ACMHYB_00490 [Sorangium sp. So ce1128]
MTGASGQTGESAASHAPGAGLTALARRLRQGDASSLPVLLGLLVIWGIFASQNENFLSARNLTNLVLQIAAMGTISVGIVLVLLLGEIDLSVGAVSGMSAAVMAILNVQHEVSPALSLLAGVAAVFTLCGALAASGGILATSRLLAVNQSSGGGDVLLNAIAAAVIGGTSLFGGRGTVWSALTGALLIGSISNGMDLLALPSSVKFMVTGAALLAAVTIDASARSGRQPAGRT